MPRLHGSSGSAIVFALVAVMLIATLGVFTAARASDSNTRSGSQRINSIADSAADAAVAVAIARIQRVGSVKGESDETDGSTLDVTNGNINGADDADGTYNIKVQSGQPGCYNPRQRLLTVTAKAEGQTRRRYLCFWVVPRIMRFGLYTDGGATAANAAEVKSGFALMLPPPYKAPKGARGSDMGSNGSVQFAAGSYANHRNSGSLPALTSLYDYLYIPNGTSSPTNQADYRFGSESSPGTRWGNLYRAPRLGGTGSGSLPNIQGVGAGVNFDTPGAINTPAVNTFEPVTLATRTQPPDFSQMTSKWRQKASLQGNLFAPGDLQATPDDFQSEMNQLGTKTMQGIIYVSCTDDKTITIPTGKELVIQGGGLIMDGCNLLIDSGASLKVERDLSDPYYKVKGSNAGSCSTSGELTSVPGGCAWSYPGLAVLTDGDNNGGNITSKAKGSSYVDINGNVIVGKNLTITGGDLPSGGKLGNWNTAGTTFVDGKLEAGSALAGFGGAAVFRWIPLGQRMDFDSSTSRIGTYSLRTEERALPTSAPSITFTQKPANPSDQIRQAEFAWDINGSYDTVDCTLTKEGGSTDAVACADTSATVTGLDYPANYTFSVKACVMGLDATRTQRQFCATESYDWYIKGPPARVTIDSSSKPSDPSFTRSATFTWIAENNPTSINCRMDGGSWGSCTSPPGYSATNLATEQNHTFEVRACNFDGCGTDSHTWYVAGPPTVNITNKPSSPQPYTATSLTLNWTVSGRNVTSTECSNTTGSPAPAESWGSCSTATSKSLSGLATNTTHNFKVRVCNPAGCNTDSTSWFLNPNPPSCSWSATATNPSQYNITRPTFTWNCSGGPITTRECRVVPSPDTGSGWGPCSTTTSDTRDWDSCKTHTFAFRASNVSGNSTISHTWTINCSPPTLEFTAKPAATVAYTSRTGAFSYRATNNVPVLSYECNVDGDVNNPSSWFACSSSYTTGTLGNWGVYGVGHNFYVRGVSSGGTGPYIQHTWTIYPDPIGTPYFYSAPPTVDYPSGSSIGYFDTSGGARIWQCYSTAQGYWYDCGNPNWFATAGYCNWADAYIRAYNVTSGWVQSGGASFRRWCDAPNMRIQWESCNGCHRDHDWAQRRSGYYIYSNASPDYCDYKRSLDGGWNVERVFWSSGNWCANPIGISWVGQKSWFSSAMHLWANDRTREAWFNSAPNYNSNGLGYLCAKISDWDPC